jgi:hypothetical protein
MTRTKPSLAQEHTMSATAPSTRTPRRGSAALALSAATMLVLTVAATPAGASSAFGAEVIDGTLLITGGPQDDRITLRLAAANAAMLEVDLGDDGSADASFVLATFGSIEVDAGNGDDAVRIDQSNGTFTTLKPTRMSGGNGDDTFFGGTGAETYFGGRGDDVVDGNAGADTGFLGQGDDTFIWDPGDGSDTVEGEFGWDTMLFNGSGQAEIFAASANGGRVRFTRNLGSIVMDLDDVEAIDLRALGGADSTTVNDARGTDLRRVAVDLAEVIGGAASDRVADTVTVVGTADVDSIAATLVGSTIVVDGLVATTAVTHTDATLDRLVIDSGAGDDDVTLDPALAGAILSTVQ